jgi:hypothetical protein
MYKLFRLVPPHIFYTILDLQCDEVTLKILLYREDSIDVLDHLVVVGHFGDLILERLNEGDDEGVRKAAEFNHIYI